MKNVWQRFAIKSLLSHRQLVIGLGTGILLLFISHMSDFDDHLYYWWADQTHSEVTKISEIWLPHYRVEREALPIPGVENNASGITFSPVSQSLFVVINRPAMLVELNLELQPIREIPLEAFADPEAIAYAGQQQFIITDEREQGVVMVEITPATQTINKGDWPMLQLNLNGRTNKGFEGVAVDRKNKMIYVVKERDPLQLLQITGFINGNQQVAVNTSQQIAIEEFDMNDLSGLHFDPRSGNLLVLSDESQLVAEIELSGKLMSYMDLEAGFNGLKQSIPQAEGITMDEQGNLYIVSEPNLIYRYHKTHRVD